MKVFSGGSPQLARYPEPRSLNSPPSLPTPDIRTDAEKMAALKFWNGWYLRKVGRQ